MRPRRTGTVYHVNSLATRFDACRRYLPPASRGSLVLAALSRHAIQLAGSIIGTKFQRLHAVG